MLSDIYSHIFQPNWPLLLKSDTPKGNRPQLRHESVFLPLSERFRPASMNVFDRCAPPHPPNLGPQNDPSRPDLEERPGNISMRIAALAG